MAATVARICLRSSTQAKGRKGVTLETHGRAGRMQVSGWVSKKSFNGKDLLLRLKEEDTLGAGAAAGEQPDGDSEDAEESGD